MAIIEGLVGKSFAAACKKGENKMYQPLAGFKVLDCSRLLPFQYCTCILGDLGATVLKIEQPGIGDYGRWIDADSPGKYRLSFLMLNRNKESMTLNLKSEAGKDIFKKLAAQYDVVFETFRPGVMDRLGLGYSEIKAVNPKIIYCSGTGYGQNGPYKLRAGHDINYISIAGILGMTGMHTGRPVLPGVPFADMAGGGAFPALTIIAALLGREKTGEGQYIDVSMTDVMTSFNVGNLANAMARRAGDLLPPYDILGRSVCYNTYKTKDGKFISIGNNEPKFWKGFCTVIGREDLNENHWDDYHEGSGFTETIKAAIAAKTQAEWIELFEKEDSCFAPVHTADDILEDPQLIDRDMITSMHDPRKGDIVHIGFPARFSDTLDYKRSPAPELGEQTDEKLGELGYTPGEIEGFKNGGVV